MATAGAVLGVIRASRPSLKTSFERVAFAVHAAFLAAGYSLVAAGSKANTCAPDAPLKAIRSCSPLNKERIAKEGVEEPEVGIEGWNDMEGAYAFRYTGGGQQELCQAVTVKSVVMGDSLMVDAAPTDSDTLLHLEIRAGEYARDDDAGNYAQQFTNCEGLVGRINSSLLSKLSRLSTKTAAVSPAATSSSVEQNERQSEVRRASALPLLFDSRRPIASPGFMFPPIPVIGGGDLYPNAGGGIFAPRRDIGSESMFVGPNDVRWGRPGSGLQPGFPDLGQPGVPPGARFDPYGPPGVPGFEPNRLVRPPHRPPGGHPDLEHFPQDF